MMSEGFGIGLMIVLLILLMVPTIVIVLATVILALAKRKSEDIKNKRAGTIVTQFSPPLDLTPAEIGLLYDSKCDRKEIRATLFDLQNKQIIRIDSKDHVSVIDQQKYNDLPEYAKIAVRMFSHQAATSDKRQLSIPITQYADISPEEIFASTVSGSDVHLPKKRVTTINIPIPAKQTLYSFTHSVLESLQSKGFIIKNYRFVFWKYVLILTAIMLLLLTIPFITSGAEVNGRLYPALSPQSILTGILASMLFGILLLPLFTAMSLGIVALFTKIAGKHSLNTKQVRELWPQLEGYRRFLETVDLSRIQFESENTNQKPVVDSLPYAIVLKLDTKWQQRQ